MENPCMNALRSKGVHMLMSKYEVLMQLSQLYAEQAEIHGKEVIACQKLSKGYADEANNLSVEEAGEMVEVKSMTGEEAIHG